MNQANQSVEYNRELIRNNYYRKEESTAKYSLGGIGIGAVVIPPIGFFETYDHSPNDFYLWSIGGACFVALSLIFGIARLVRLDKKMKKEIRDLEGTVS